MKFANIYNTFQHGQVVLIVAKDADDVRLLAMGFIGGVTRVVGKRFGHIEDAINCFIDFELNDADRLANGMAGNLTLPPGWVLV